MKRITQLTMALALLGLMTAVGAQEERFPGFASHNEPHGVVTGMVDREARGLFSVRIVKVNGREIPERELGVWLKPGRHEIMAVGDIRRDLVRGVNRDPTWISTEPLVIEVEEGKTYYIARQADSSRREDWKLVVWKIKDSNA